MGVDIYALNSKLNTDSCFSANWAGWRQIWGFCCEIHPDITGKVFYAYTNDGDGLGQDDCEILGMRVHEEASKLKSSKDPQESSHFKSASSLAFCSNCHKTCTENKDSEIREPYLAEDFFMADICFMTAIFKQCPEFNPDINCEFCGGTGLEVRYRTLSAAGLDRITEFGNFLVNCGGFSIL